MFFWHQGRSLNLGKVNKTSSFCCTIGIYFRAKELKLDPVDDIIKQLNIKYHCYADDTQVYMTLKTCDKWDDNSSSIKACIEDISICMNSNMLTE